MLLGILALLLLPAGASRLDGHSSAEYLRHLDKHVSTYESTLAVTKDMYQRIGQLQQRNPPDPEGAPLRIHAEMSTPKMCPGPHCEEYKFLAEKLMPAALKEVSRRYKITRPTQGPLKLPMQCKGSLPSGNCAEVMDLNDQPPLCRNPEMYAGYELCKVVDGNLHCVTMLGGSGFNNADFALMVGMDVEGSVDSEMPSSILNKDVFIPGVFDAVDDLAEKLIQDTYGADKQNEESVAGNSDSEANGNRNRNKAKNEDSESSDKDEQKADRESGKFQEIPDFFDFHLRRLASTGELDLQSMCKAPGMLAYSGQCGYDMESGRPLAGFVTFCPGAIDVNGNMTDMLEDAVHQIVHAMYMSGSLVRLYDPNADASKSQSSRGPSQLQTPAVIRAAQEHFDCEDIKALELEEVPGADGLVTSHWSTRWLAGELMTPHLGPHPATLSMFTASLAEDTGWYKYNHRITPGILKYGLKAGCDFLEAAGKCHKPSKVSGSNTFCAEASSSHRCTPDGLGHAPCGEVDGLPGCYSPAASEQIHSCLDPMSLSSARETMFGVYHGYKSRCLEVEEPMTVSLGMMEETMEPGAKCFKFDCKDDELFLILGMHNVRCPTGERIKVEDLDIDAGFQDGLLGPCPDNSMMCNSMKCPHDCSNHGVCNPLSSDGTCGCDLGFGFSRLGGPGAEDCSSSLLCSSDAACAPLQCNGVNGACGFAIQKLPPSQVNGLIFSAGFTKSITGLMGAIDIHGTTAVEEHKMAQVAATVMSLLDTDQDGQPDDREVIKQLKQAKPAIFLYADRNDMSRLLSRQDVLARTQLEAAMPNREELLASEIFTDPGPDDPPDAGLLIVLQLLFRHGWSAAHPDAKDKLIEAMDEAAGDCGYKFCDGAEDHGCKWRGDDQTGCSGMYHDGTDSECGLDCLLPDYFALSLASAYGALDRPGACSALSDIWSGCTERDMQRRNAMFFEAVEAYNPASQSRRRQLLAQSKGIGLVHGPILPVGSVYRQYDAKTFNLSQPLKHGAELDADIELTISGEDLDIAKMRRARDGSSDSSRSDSQESSESDSSEGVNSASSFYGGDDVLDPSAGTSFYSTSFYSIDPSARVLGNQSRIANNEVVVFGNPKTAMGQTIDAEQTQTWEQLVLGLIASMEGRQEGNKEDTARAVEHTCIKDRFSQCCDAPNHLDASMGCCSAEIDRCGVCNGAESSCALKVVLRIAAREDLEVDVLVGRLKSELGLLLADFMITPDQIKVDLASMEQVSRRRLLTNGLGNKAPPNRTSDEALAGSTAGSQQSLEAGWVEVDITLSVLPPDYNSNFEQSMMGPAADFLAEIDGAVLSRQPDGLRFLRATHSVITGVCGNHICEWGEMLSPEGLPGSCPEDCPALPTSFALAGNSSASNATTICPDVDAACQGGDTQACFEATMAATDLQCLGLDDASVPPLDVEVPPISAEPIAPCVTDRDGECCPAPGTLDASLVCCREAAGVDACGVCAGENSTCATTALLRVAAPSSLEVKAFVGNVQEAVAEILLEEGVDSSAVTVGVDAMVRLPDNPALCKGMLDGERVLPAGVASVHKTTTNGTVPKECELPSDWLQLEFPVSVHPSQTSSALKPAPPPEKITEAIERKIQDSATKDQQKLMILTLLETNATGICGNGVCESGEMGDPRDPINSPGSCPADCPAVSSGSMGVAAPANPKTNCPRPKVSLVASLSQDCGGRGSCDRETGACMCHEGYASSDCSLCAKGFIATNGECSRLPAAARLEPTVQDLSASPKSGSSKEWALVLVLGAVAGVCLLIASVTVVYLIWRRNRRAESASEGQGQGKQAVGGPIPPWQNAGLPEKPATNADEPVSAHEVSFDITQDDINPGDLDASFESSLRGMVMTPADQQVAGSIRSLVSLPMEDGDADEGDARRQGPTSQDPYPSDITERLG